MELEALIDSGVESFMDWSLALKYPLGVKKLTNLLKASALNSSLIFQVTHITEFCQMSIDAVHQENIRFHLFNTAQHPLI